MSYLGLVDFTVPGSWILTFYCSGMPGNSANRGITIHALANAPMAWATRIYATSERDTTLTPIQLTSVVSLNSALVFSVDKKIFELFVDFGKSWRQNARLSLGGVPEWPKGSDCKSDGSAFGG
ncbi:MAG: hypothetical protein JAY85_09245, partial [Candidatus Thiodiazotropha weberae]|nr:hypothetical protein [Candidatus Thiodiazotropha weberae]